MASSSSAIDNCDDVFLSFRGVDTRCNLIGYLHDALCRNNIKVFIDYDIKRGDEITPALERAIEGARISIVIFSPHYASSTSCLHELVKIMECRESKNQIVLPIFYKVEPSKATYQEAFDRHKSNIYEKKGLGEETMEEEIKKVEKWESALHEAFKLAGWHIKKNSVEIDVIREITKIVSEKLKSSQSNREKLMCKPIIGQRAEDIFKQVWEWLMNDNISRVGIYGMGGVGKTTLATRINNELLDSNVFAHVCWVTISRDMSIRKLQNEIAKTINLDLSNEGDELKRAAKLRQRLKIEKFVLILDDVWEAFETEEVGIPSLVSGQKLLLTSRNRRVCEIMECQPIEVTPLSKQESLELFLKESKHKIRDSQEWKTIVYSIVKECGGLPLAIVVVARIMKKPVEIWKWRNTLKELQKPCQGENQDVEKQVFRSLKLSYDCLPNDKVRQCFLYYSLFPEDYEFKRNDLITYLIGEGIINELDSKQAELDMGHCIIDELINASLFEHKIRDGVNYIKMHDVVRDMALIIIRENSKAQDGLKLHGVSEETEKCVNPESVLIVRYSMLERGVPNLPPNCSKLTTLSMNVGVEALPSSLFAKIRSLCVLDMCGLESLKLLPDSISYLTNLRVLLLRWCRSLEYIPSLARLKNLRHLDLFSTNLKEKPKGMEGLINLRVLKMSSSAFISLDFLEKLSHLQILEIEKVHVVKRSIKPLLPKLLFFLAKIAFALVTFSALPSKIAFPLVVTFSALPILKLEVVEVEVDADILNSLKELETLRIVFYNLKNLSSYFKSGHWRKLKEYFIVYSPKKGLSAIKLWENQDEHKKILYISELRDFKVLNRETDLVLPNNIQHLMLEEWNGPMVEVVMNNNFDNLRRLHIYRCRGIQHLFTPALVQKLCNVEILHIDGWANMGVKEIISAEEELVGEINNYTTIHLPHLKSLTLTRLTKLRSIYKGIMVCPSLKLIVLQNCAKLKRLPFCMEERNNHVPIQLKVFGMQPNKWWNSLHWDDYNARSMYQFQILSIFETANLRKFEYLRYPSEDPTPLFTISPPNPVEDRKFKQNYPYLPFYPSPPFPHLHLFFPYAYMNLSKGQQT